MKRHYTLLSFVILSGISAISLAIYYYNVKPFPVSISGLIIAFFAINIPAIFVISFFAYLQENQALKLFIYRILKQLIYSSNFRIISLIIFLICVVNISIKSSFYPQQGSDYGAYLIQWSWVLNAYAPNYNALAIFSAINPLVPRLIFCIFWIAASLYLIKLLCQRYPENYSILLASILFLLANPFLWISVSMQAYFDILPATFCLTAVAFRVRRNFALAGLFLGIGVLLKYYPIVLLPILMIDNRRVRIIPAITCIGLTLLGFLISFFIWGTSTFNPLLFASGRHSKILSIFYFLRSRFSPFHLFVTQPNLDAYSNYILIVGWLLVLFYIWKRRTEVSLASVICIMTVFVLYKVGHFQFYTSIFLLVPFWYASSNLPESRKQKILVPIAMYLYWIMTLHLTYYLFRGIGPWPWSLFREIAGLPNLLLSLWSIVTAIRLGSVNCLGLRRFHEAD